MKRTIKFSDFSKMIGGIDLSALDGRISFQKRMYFASVFDVIKVEDYKWYVYGTYSGTIARIGFEFIEDNIDSDIQINENNIEKLNEFLEKNQTGIVGVRIVARSVPETGTETICLR